MYSSVLALLCRSLRVDVRSRGAHLARMGLMVAIYFSVLFVQAMASTGSFGAPGLQFFRSILYLNLAFLTLIGIGAFSSTISEEKEEDALGLLRMAGVDSIGLLLGKVGGRLCQALTLLIVQYPFILLSITLGGVGVAQVQAAYIALAAYLILLAGVGVLCSTVTQTTRSSSRLMVLALVLYVAAPVICQGWIQNGTPGVFLPVVQFLSAICVFNQTGEILTSTYVSSAWNIQVVSNSLAGTACFLLAWALFDICSRSTRTEPITRGFVTTNKKGFRWFNPGRARGNALVWKDFHFVAGGIAGLLIRAACYLTVFALVCVSSIRENNFQLACRIFLGVQMFALPFDASLLISRAMQDEVRGQTIPSLVMLPCSVPRILYSKLGGALLGLIPGLVCFAVTLLCSGVMEDWLRPGAWNQRSFTLYLLPNLLLLPHLTALIALVARWGATPLAIGALYAIQIVESMVFGMLFFAVRMGGSPDLFFALMGLFNLSLCAACHFEMIRRFRKLAEK